NFRNMAVQNSYLHNIVGKVIEIHPPFKAIVSFQYRGKPERALLWADKIIIDGKNVPMNEPIDDYICEGSTLKFTCHSFNVTGQDHCGYFVTMAWRQDSSELSSLNSNSSVFLGIYNASGIVSDVSQRQGVITYTDANDKEQNILFLASKLFLFGKRVSAKQNLQLTLVVDDKVQFDAVPCEPSENDSHCPWFATLVWKGKKPSIEYDNPPTITMEPKNIVAEIRHLTSNPKSGFVRGEGQILHILNEEFGIALGALKNNNWESILFHRSACFLFKLNLGSHDLTKIFQEGDKIHFIAASAPKQYMTLWVASQIIVHFNKDIDI
ncbi:hypothetical protein L9F63_024730, partial [Diploptera punctata]